MSESFDQIILGGGSGLTAAFHAEADGQDVALVEPGPLGGTCVNHGCIPTKTLIQSAETMRTIRQAGDLGIHLDQDKVDIDFPGIMQRMREMRKRNVGHSDDWIENSEQITLFRDKARFVDDTTVDLFDDGIQLTADTVFVTTGARPLIPPVDGLDGVDYLTNRSLLNELDEQPDSLAILGGGYIGLEFAHFFASLGTEVTILEMLDTVAAPEDPDVREVLTDAVAEFTELHLGTMVTGVHEDGGQIVVEGERDDGDETTEVEADELLVAAGRRPNTEELDLETAGVETDDKGFIEADEGFQTTNPDVYAYGDVIGRGMFKHTSSFEGEIAYRNSQGADEELDYRTNPHAIFTHPQVGGVGLTEEEADEHGLDYRTATTSYLATAKGEIVQPPEDAFAKAIVEEGTEKILGFHVVGPQAADLIHEVVVAMGCGEGTVENVTNAIHVHPTLSELVHTLFGQV